MPGLPKDSRTAHGMLPGPLRALANALVPEDDPMTMMPGPAMMTTGGRAMGALQKLLPKGLSKMDAATTGTIGSALSEEPAEEALSRALSQQNEFVPWRGLKDIMGWLGVRR